MLMATIKYCLASTSMIMEDSLFRVSQFRWDQKLVSNNERAHVVSDCYCSIRDHIKHEHFGNCDVNLSLSAHTSCYLATPPPKPSACVFNWLSKIIPELLWFRFTTLYDWFKKTRATLSFSTNQMQNQNQSRLALCAGYVYLIWIFIGSLCWLSLLWFAIITGLVMVSWSQWIVLTFLVSCFQATTVPDLRFIELRVHSNYGNPSYTCLYRFRVHGSPYKNNN